MTKAAPPPGPDPEGTSPGREAGAEPGLEHEETGLELARSIARSLAGRRTPKGRGQGASGRGRRRYVDPQSSGSHADDRDPQLLDATIGRLINEHGWDRDVRVHGVFSRWNAIVGDEVALHARPVSFEREDGGGRLVVLTDSTAWATQMRMLAANVVRRLNEELGDGTVSTIEVRGPTAPSWSRGRRSVRGGRGPRDTYG